MSDVFISYAAPDGEMAKKVGDFLESRDIGCGMIPPDGFPGVERSEAVTAHLQACRIVVLIFSQHANDSETISDEVAQAIKAHKVLIPFRIENVAPSGTLKMHIGRRYCVDAFTPPLEKHLELIARTLKPLTHRRIASSGEAPTDDTIMRTLPSRSLIVRRSDSPAAPSSSAPAGSLQISFDFNHVVVAGHASAFQLLLENRGLAPLHHLELLMESRGLDGPLTLTAAELEPGGNQRHLLEINPIRSGLFVLQVAAQWREGEKQVGAFGSRPFRVNPPPEKTDQVSEMHDLLGNSDPSPTLGGGDPALDQIVASGVFPNLNELLDFQLPESFEPLSLAPDYEISTAAWERSKAPLTLQIPAAGLGRTQAGTLLKLEPMGRSETGFAPEIRLVARPTFSFGRLREEADFLTWFWPRNEVHDTKTRRLSKKHCTLTISKGRLYVCNVASASLTTFDDQEVPGLEGLPLRRRGLLNLSGIYFIDVHHLPPRSPQGPEITNLAEWQGPAAAAVSAVTGCVRFLSKTPHVLTQNVLWLLTEGSFGTSQVNALALELTDLAEIQGRFHHLRGAFWLENVAEQGTVEIDGGALRPGSIMPLVDGQVVTLGNQAYRVTVTA